MYTLYQCQRMTRRKNKQYNHIQQRKKTQLFKLQSKLAWRQLKGKKGYIIGNFINEKKQQYVHNLYMHNGIMLMTLNIETSYNDIKYRNII